MTKEAIGNNFWIITLERVYRRDQEERVTQVYELVIPESSILRNTSQDLGESYGKSKNRALRQSVKWQSSATRND